jgi:hypothetical protein
MADDFERAGGRIRGQNVVIRSKCIFQSLAGLKIAELPPGIKNPRDAHQVALLANAVAGAGLQFCRIDDRAGFRVRKMPSAGTVAALATDGRIREHWFAILIVSTGNVKYRSCVTKDATFRDWSCEIRILCLLISGSQIV